MEPPFVLLDDARPDGAGVIGAGPTAPARLYRDPVRVLTAHTPAQVHALLDAIREATASGLSAAGFLSYEAAASFEPALPAPAAGLPVPLAWFGLFDGWQAVADVPAWLPDPNGARVGDPRPLVTRDEYAERFAAVQALIAAGDLYQANLSFPAAVTLLGDPLTAYAAVRARARPRSFPSRPSCSWPWRATG